MTHTRDEILAAVERNGGWSEALREEWDRYITLIKEARA